MGRQERVDPTPDPTPEVAGQLDLTEATSSGGNPTDVPSTGGNPTDVPSTGGNPTDVKPAPDSTDDAANDGRAYDERGNVRPADARMGEVWEIPATSDVIVTRPGGVRVRIISDGDSVQHVLDVPGEYVADTGDSVTAG